jgi:uncharacterized protein YhhL (DUF1145 family)
MVKANFRHEYFIKNLVGIQNVDEIKTLWVSFYCNILSPFCHPIKMLIKSFLYIDIFQFSCDVLMFSNQMFTLSFDYP